MSINDYLRKTREETESGYLKIRPAIECADGFVISVQASSFHYCEPRSNDSEVYESVELGFPSEREDLIMEYAEDPDRPTDTVYGYVPVQLVDRVIEKHGGIIC